MSKQNSAFATWGPGLATPFCPTFANLSFVRIPISPSLFVHPRQFLWLKGRRHLSSRKDFNWQRCETARIATLSQQLSDG